MSTFAIEIHGVLAPFAPEEPFFGEPIVPAVEIVRALHEAGHKITIHTWHRELPSIYRFLGVNSIPYNDIWVGSGKPRADFYINTLTDLLQHHVSRASD